jgi:acyl-CoA synthetase (AMP-forming)/AMP-acid ligase II
MKNPNRRDLATDTVANSYRFGGEREYAGFTIPDVLARRGERDAEVQALVSDDAAITYRELDRASRELARRFVTAGVGKSARVGLMMPNGIEWATTALAIMRVGGVLVPLSTLLRPPELLAQLRVAAVTHLVVVRAYRDRAYLDDLESIAPGIAVEVAAGRRHPALPSLRHLSVAGELATRAAPLPVVAAMEAAVRPADDMAIMFTSGSRGAPKGVIHTHGNALRATSAGLEDRCVGRGDRLYIPMPFFWMGGFGGGLLSALLAGATLLTESTPEPARTIELLQRERVTLFRGWPDQAARIAADPAFASADLSSLRPASLSAVLPAEMQSPPGSRANLFGMTESFGPYCGARLDLDLPEAKRGSCGRPFAGVDVRVTDPDTGAEVARGAQGQIELRGAHLMRGICGRARSTVFRADGFYATGDLGTLDTDGYLWYAGRLDDMFKVKGATVYPAEVEAGLRAIPGVAQAFVSNLIDADGANQVAAVVVARECSEAQLVAEARARMSAFKIPTVWLVTAEPGIVPMSPTGKVDKGALQALLSEQFRRITA